jgi:hypothetical protein
MSGSKWPSGIPKEHRRSWVTTGTINKWFKVGGLQAASYIAKVEKLGSPIKHRVHNGSKCYRALDVIARARAECLEVKPAGVALERQNIVELKRTCIALEQEVKELETLKSAVTHTLDSSVLSEALTGKAMVYASEIVAQSVPYENQCGVYFLIASGRVVYVGQSVQIGTRLSDHAKTKDFDAYTYISCPKDKLDVLESLYIHALDPEYQGRSGYEGERIAAPYSFEQLSDMGKPA